MKSGALISVIVPVYNVEEYLDRCVKSIVTQTYSNLEIILVDDGSSDNCPAMCDVWVERDSRVKVIHKENGGLSDARNAGMAIAIGEMIGFVDSDDWISPDMYQLLYQRMVDDDSDITVCGVEMRWGDGVPPRMLTKPGSCVLNCAEAMEAIVQETWLKQPVWYKLYKAELIRDIPFPVGKYHEDVFWSYQAVARSRRVSVFDTPCYYYSQRFGSIMGEGYSLKRLDGLEAKVTRLAYVEEYFPQLVCSAKCELLFSCMYAFQMCLKNLPPAEIALAQRKIKEAINLMRPFYPEKTMSIKQRVWFYTAQLSFEMTCKLRNRLKIGA